MEFLVRLLIGLLLFFVQIGISYSIQSEAAPIVLSLIVTILYGVWCENYILGFSVGFLSPMAYPVAVIIFYSLHGYGMETLSSFLRHAFLGFFLLSALFGIIGIVTAKLVGG